MLVAVAIGALGAVCTTATTGDAVVGSGNAALLVGVGTAAAVDVESLVLPRALLPPAGTLGDPLWSTAIVLADVLCAVCASVPLVVELLLSRVCVVELLVSPALPLLFADGFADGLADGAEFAVGALFWFEFGPAGDDCVGCAGAGAGSGLLGELVASRSISNVFAGPGLFGTAGWVGAE